MIQNVPCLETNELTNKNEKNTVHSAGQEGVKDDHEQPNILGN